MENNLVLTTEEAAEFLKLTPLHGAGLCQTGNSAVPQGGQGVAVL